MKLSYRNYITPNDYESVYELLEKSGFFYESEINNCLQMMEETIEYDNEKSDYHWLIVEGDNNVVGFACFGKNAMTQDSWEVFWLAAAKKHKDKGIGTLILKEVERIAMGSKANRIWIQTSGKDKFIPTVKFLESKEYEKVASLPDFYAKGDPKIIFNKVL